MEIYQDQLNDFLVIAEELQLKGLATSEENQQRLPLESKAKHQVNRNQNNLQHIAHVIHTKVKELEQNDTHESPDLINTMNNDHTKVVRIAENDDQNQRMCELIEWTEDNWVCTICGKMTAKTNDGKKNLKRHTHIHMEGLSYPWIHSIQDHTYKCQKKSTHSLSVYL